jgi:hypothetical protein
VAARSVESVGIVVRRGRGVVSITTRRRKGTVARIGIAPRVSAPV